MLFRKFFITILFSIVLIGSDKTLAHDGSLTFSQMEIRATTKGIKTSAAYVHIINNSKFDDRLIRVEARVAKRAEIHNMIMENDIMRMRPVYKGLSIRSGESLNLVPGGLHIMLMGLNTILIPESQHEIILFFEKAGKVVVSAKVKHPSAIKSKSLGHGHGHGETKHTQ